VVRRVFTIAQFLYQPPASYGPKTWNEATGPGPLSARARHIPLSIVGYPIYRNFDAQRRYLSACASRSNTSLQALDVNDCLYECARALAADLEQGGQSDADRVTYAFRRVLSRRPTSDEQAELLGLLQRQKQRIADGWVNPLELATGKNEPPANLPAGTTPTMLAAYATVSRVLLNLDETITKE
jgi:hypothetical protein